MNGIKKLDITDSEYPEILKLIKDPPTSLYYSGNIELLSNRCISIVGARKATEYGIETAEEIGRKTGEAGLTVVSGMADGIDTAAHRGAINTAGGTIAVLGCGIDMETGERRKRALDRIRSSGLVISEYPNGYPASKYTFPRRNRIISGLSAATVVVEAGFNSGSLITAELAAEQGRCVYAVPGNIDSGMSLGTNKLIKDGAVPVVSINDILIDAGVYNNEETKKLGKDERLIYDILLKNGEMRLEQLCKAAGRRKSLVSSIVTILEIKGLVFTSYGKIFIAK